MNTTECTNAYPPMEGTVTLDAIVGEGHKGGIVVYLDGEEIEAGQDELQDVDLGPAGELRNRGLTVVATVIPMSASSRASLSCTLKSGVGSSSETCSVEDHEGELQKFRMIYHA